MMYVVLSNHVETKSGDRKRQRQTEKEERAQDTQEEEPGKYLCHLPQKTKGFFFINMVDLPGERTQHGKGPMYFHSQLSFHLILLESNLNTNPIHSIYWCTYKPPNYHMISSTIT